MKERAVEFAPEARDDLIALYDWIAGLAGSAVAMGYLDKLEVFCMALSIGSERGRRRDDIRDGLRILGFKRRVTLAFVVEPDRVVVLRLFYAGRNWEDDSNWPESRA